MDTNTLEKKNCLITGATGGLGKQIAIELAKKNCNLFLTARQNKKLEKLNGELEKIGKNNLIKYKHCNLQVELLISVATRLGAQSRHGTFLRYFAVPRALLSGRGTKYLPL